MTKVKSFPPEVSAPASSTAMGSDQRPRSAGGPRSCRPTRADHRRESTDTDAGSATPITWVGLSCVSRLSRSIGGGHSDLIPHDLRVCRFNRGRSDHVGVWPHPSRHCSVVRALPTEARTNDPLWVACTTMLKFANATMACGLTAVVKPWSCFRRRLHSHTNTLLPRLQSWVSALRFI